MRQSKPFCLLGSLVLLLGAGATAHADPVITVFPSISPNLNSPTNVPGYASNGAPSIQNNTGAPNGSGPLAFAPPPAGAVAGNGLLTVNFGQLIVSSNFDLWNGQLNPGTVYGPAFFGQRGNMALFPVDIKSSTPISLANVSFTETDTSGNSTINNDFDITGDTFSHYSDTILGYDASGHLITTPGEAANDPSLTGRVFQIVMLTEGAGDAATSIDPTNQADNQAALNQSFANVSSSGPFFITGTYTYTVSPSDSVSASGDFGVGIPEPASFALWGLAAALGLGTMLVRRYRRVRLVA